MRILIVNGMTYRNESRSFLPMDILVEDGNIVTVAQRGTLDGIDARVLDACGRRLTSGLIDVHSHGIAGFDFLSESVDLSHMSRAYLSHGVTAVMPTLASAPLCHMLSAAKRIKDFESADGACFCGVHIEGRYLNPQKRGAHASELLSSLCAEELCDFAELSLPALHISAAFELDTDKSFAKKALDIGATLSLGHTCATFEQALECERAGVTAYTHLFNAMPPLHHREGGAVAACLLGNSYAELICDGIHVSQEMVRLAFGVKRDRLVLISDSMEATDCVDGEYSIAGNSVTVENGIARTLDGALAGSTLTLDKALKNLMEFCDISLEEAIISVTEAPAREVGIFDSYGSLDAGKRADILFINQNAFEIEMIMREGREVLS